MRSASPLQVQQSGVAHGENHYAAAISVPPSILTAGHLSLPSARRCHSFEGRAVSAYVSTLLTGRAED